MKIILQLLFIYFIVIGSIFSLFLSTNSRELKQLSFTQSELAGVSYLTGIYRLSISLALYKEGLEIDEPKELQLALKLDMIKDIDALYILLKKYPQFTNKKLHKKLVKLSNSQFNDAEYYEFLSYVNHENYKIGDISRLLFEEDRKLYFLGSLTTHYLPEYLISILIVHNKIEEFKHNKTFNDEQKRLFTEQNKLIHLSLEELNGIISLLKPYPETEKLSTLILDIQTVLTSLKTHTKSLKKWEKDENELELYLLTTYRLLSLSFELNDESTRLLETGLEQREKVLQEKIFHNQLGLLFLVLLISFLAYYFYRSYSLNLKKDAEIKKINKTLDKSVIYSRTDKAGKITHVSTALVELSGYSKDELIGKSHNIFKHPDMKDEIFSDLWKTISKKQTWEGEVKNLRKDLSSYWVKLIITVDCDNMGKIIGYDAYREEISDKKALELEKQKSQRALEFKSMFLSNMSHEIRTPLNGIIGFTHLALKTKLDKKQSNLINKIESASVLLLGVINDILDISKIESGKMTVENISFNLKDSIENILSLHQIKAEEKGISLEVDYQNFQHFNVLGDPQKLSQVLTNLINNAIKFTHKGGVTLTLRNLASERILFEVHDTGIGLKEEQRVQLFEEFIQADMSTSRKYGGTGLGLAICKKLVELMGGTIEVESAFTLGSTFSFILPLKRDLQEISTHKELKEEELTVLEKKVNELKGIHILVAEDNKMNQMLLEMLLENTSLQLEFAEDGKIALDKYKTTSYDLILMDIQMPNMNGYDTTKEIRKLDKEIPIIALSANVMQADIEKSIEVGMNGHLAKPIEIHKLYEVLLKHLDS